MEKIFGLDYLTSKFDRYTLDTLPHSILIIGKEGSGKHVISKYLSDKFNLNLLDISDNLSDELIDNIYRDVSPRFYLVDLRKITEKEQNILLKLFEEPSANAYIILLANSTFSVLPTILNRGQIFNINIYDKATLMEFAKEKDVKVDPCYFGNIVETPGDVKKLYSSNISMNAITDLVDKIINKINIASYANTLTIVNKLNFKDEYDKIDVDFFLKTLYYNSAEECIKGNDKAYTIYSNVGETLRKLTDTRLNKRILVTQMLSEIWLEAKRWNYAS